MTDAAFVLTTPEGRQRAQKRIDDCAHSTAHGVEIADTLPDCNGQVIAMAFGDVQEVCAIATAALEALGQQQKLGNLYVDRFGDIWKGPVGDENLHYARLEGRQADSSPCWVLYRSEPDPTWLCLGPVVASPERRDTQGGLSEDAERFLSDIETRPGSNRDGEYDARIVSLTASERDALCAVVRRLSAPASSAALSEKERATLAEAMADISDHVHVGDISQCPYRYCRVIALVQRLVESPSRSEQPSEGGISEEERARVERFRDENAVQQVEGDAMGYSTAFHAEALWVCDLVQRLAVPPSAPTRSKE